MDPTAKTMKDALEAIRNMATNALSQIERPHEEYSMRWTCKACGTPLQHNRLKITRMRRADKIALDRGVAGDVPAGEVFRFKPAIGDEVCLGGIGT